MYQYRAIVVKVSDGDTVVVDVDLGFELTQRHILRFYGLNTPELHSKNPEERIRAVEARKFVVDRIPPTTEVELDTKKDKQEKYGRYLADIYFTDSQGNRQCLNKMLIDAGLADEYYGKPKRTKS
jgi:micrococcal nuclease